MQTPNTVVVQRVQPRPFHISYIFGDENTEYIVYEIFLGTNVL